MMPVAKLDDKQIDVLQKKADDLSRAYEIFLSHLSALEKEVGELSREARVVVDTNKIHGVLQKIANIKEY